MKSVGLFLYFLAIFCGGPYTCLSDSFSKPTEQLPFFIGEQINFRSPLLSIEIILPETIEIKITGADRIRPRFWY